MKKLNSKKGSAAKKLIPAAGMLGISAVMLGTSTFAWFTMNKEAAVVGMELKTKVSSNLLISSNNANYTSDYLSEGRKALLEPVSSVSGKTGTFYYTLDSDELGKKAHAATEYKLYNENTGDAPDYKAGKHKYDNEFNEAYGITASGDDFGKAYGYIDYVFYLKATSSEPNQAIAMTKCDLNYTYGEVDETTDKALRVALFAKKLDSGKGGIGNSSGDGLTVGQIDPAASSENNSKAILCPASAGYFTANKAVSTGDSVAEINVGGSTVTTSAGAPVYGNAVVDTLTTAGTTEYYKVLVRVWLEGEDSSCNSTTYSKLQNGYSLDLDFELVNALVESGGTTATATGATGISKNAYTTVAGKGEQTAVSTPVEVATTAGS